MATITASAQAPLIKEFIRGGTYAVQITVVNPDGTPFNLTGSTLFMTMNSSATPPADGVDSSAALKASTNSFSSPTSGVATITLSQTATSALSEGTYYYDVMLKDASGNFTPLGRNKVLVVDNITTRTS